MIIGQLGRRDAPYVYVDVFEEERYSATLDRHFRHVVLKIGYSYAGPTEIGGLIVSPEYRKKPERLGAAHLVRALPLHRDAPGLVSRRAPRRAPAAARAGRHVAPVERARAASSPT